MRLCFLFALVVLCVGPVQASGDAPSKYPTWLTKILPNLFPADAGKPQPFETLKAPFADKPFEKVSAQALPTLATPLDQAHRSAADVGQFALDVVSDTLSFQSEDEQKHLAEVKSYFSDFGFADMQSFLNTSNILPSMQGKSLQLSSITNIKPQLRSEGAVNGAYKWLFDVPITITLMPAGASSYKQAKDDIVTRPLTLRLQITRSVSSANNGLLIERFVLATQ